MPVSEVILSPSAVVEVNEKNENTFSCLAKRSRPMSNITWYRQNITVSETSSSIQSYDQPDGSLFDVRSNLTILFQKDQNGSVIYCTAHNIGRVPPRKSEEAVISVICEYIFMS